MYPRPLTPTLFPYTSLFRSVGENGPDERGARPSNGAPDAMHIARQNDDGTPDYHGWPDRYGFLASADRKSTRLNSSHRCISYAVFCLNKKNKTYYTTYYAIL